MAATSPVKPVVVDLAKTKVTKNFVRFDSQQGEAIPNIYVPAEVHASLGSPSAIRITVEPVA